MSTGQSGKTFKARSSHKPVLLFYLFAGFFLLTGIAGLIWGHPDARLFSIGVIVFCAILLYITWSQGTGRGTIYTVSKEGINLKHSYFKTFIPWDQITEVNEISKEEAESLMMTKQAAELKTAVGGSLKKAFSSRLNLGKVIRYCTVPIVFTHTGAHYNIKNWDVKTEGEFILIRTKEGEEYLISPIDIKGFVSEYSKEKPIS